MTDESVFRVMTWVFVAAVISPLVTFVRFLPDGVRLEISSLVVLVAMNVAVLGGFLGVRHYRRDKYARWSAALAAIVIAVPIGVYVVVFTLASSGGINGLH